LAEAVSSLLEAINRIHWWKNKTCHMQLLDSVTFYLSLPIITAFQYGLLLIVAALESKIAIMRCGLILRHHCIFFHVVVTLHLLM
jgi:hypothetical protein